MKLDDRPVIDQLLNPTPLNHLYDVHDELRDRVMDSEDKVQGEVDANLFTLLDLIPEGERDAGFDRIAAVAKAVAEEEQDRAIDLLQLIVSEMEMRL